MVIPTNVPNLIIYARTLLQHYCIYTIHIIDRYRILIIFKINYVYFFFIRYSYKINLNINYYYYINVPIHFGLIEINYFNNLLLSIETNNNINFFFLNYGSLNKFSW